VEDFYTLTDSLVKDVQHLEAKIVYLRYTLSKYLPAYSGEMLRCDIFSDLSRRYWDYPAYRKYMEEYNFGKDPMDDDKQAKLMMKLSRGEASANL
jgi:hypothetical protein